MKRKNNRYRSSWNGTLYEFKLTTNATSTGRSGRPDRKTIESRRNFNMRNLVKYQTQLQEIDNEQDFIKFILDTNIDDESDKDNNTGQEEGRE